MFIYQITNLTNDKKYIGQTIRTNPNYRWLEHRSLLRRNCHKNLHLQSAWNKYGETSFNFKIISQYNSLEELNLAETNMIDNNLNGYNIKSGGNNHEVPLETRIKISNSKKGKPNGQKGSKRKPLSHDHKIKLVKLHKSSYPLIVDPFGKIHEILNLREFARMYNLTQFGLRQVVVKQKYFHYKGWRLASVETIGISFSDVDHKIRGNHISQSMRPQGFPLVISPDGYIYNIEHLSKFCNEHKLSKGNFSMLINKKKSLYKGWKLLENKS